MTQGEAEKKVSLLICSFYALPQVHKTSLLKKEHMGLVHWIPGSKKDKKQAIGEHR